MSVDLNGIITWLKGWFYDKTEITGFLNNKANQSDLQTLQGTVTSLGETVAGKIDTAGTGLSKSGTTLNHSNSVTAQTSAVFKKIKYDGQGHITGTANVTSSDLPSHSHNTSDVTDPNYNNYFNITPSSSSLSDVLQGIDYAIGDMASIDAIEVVSTLPTASSDTMGKLYIISENNKVNVYYTELIGVGQYDWHKMDSDILDELSIDWSDVLNNPFSSSTPSSFATSGHSHGNISNDGKLSITDASGEIKTQFVGMSSTTANKLVWTNKLDSEVIKNTVALGNIGTNAQASQKAINTAINTVIGTINTNIASKQDIGDCITSIELVPKSDDSTGAIRLYYGDEPTNNS